ncbi:hypothetical protein B0F90DRAFT_1123950 [Multifurca ochricompacta]|uniref:C3H1-type domain-containing protein n=1 Tax=Multifurca ochricompacta TaxID=376703 RepID=A0AAD4LZR7_9AGAM|nr:hypothetical protein B0F90DRAFT_1123950 [Multifurca ochricompacta]
MASFAYNTRITELPRIPASQSFNLYDMMDSPLLHNCGATLPTTYPGKPPRFLWAKAAFGPHAAPSQSFLPRDVLEQRARTPCLHFEHHLGWCPYDMDCHFLHDYSRFPSRVDSGASSGPPTPSSSSNSFHSSPMLLPAYFPPSGSSYSSQPPSLFQVPRKSHTAHLHLRYIFLTLFLSGFIDHGFVPQTFGGTTYFPIRLDNARLGYVTPTGVQVFTDH